MDAQEYIKERLQDQIDWYNNKSQTNQSWFKRIKIFEIALAACIPFFSGFLTTETIEFRVAIGIMGILIAISAGIISIYRFQENWIEYRTTTEMLKHEKFLFLSNSNPYNIQDSFPLLVSRVESLISKENTNWSQYVKTTVEKNDS